MPEDFYNLPNARRDAYKTYFLQEITNRLVGIRKSLDSIASSLENANKKNKEETLDKILEEEK